MTYEDKASYDSTPPCNFHFIKFHADVFYSTLFYFDFFNTTWFYSILCNRIFWTTAVTICCSCPKAPHLNATHTATHCNAYCNIHYNTLQHIATHCNTMQHVVSEGPASVLCPGRIRCFMMGCTICCSCPKILFHVLWCIFILFYFIFPILFMCGCDNLLLMVPCVYSLGWLLYIFVFFFRFF